MPAVYSMRAPHPCWVVRIDRKTRWGNPFRVGMHGTREEVVAMFEDHLKKRPDLVEAIKRELRGKDLVCWCAPLPCHGDVLLRIANE